MSRKNAMWRPGRKFGRADASATRSVPSDLCVSHSSRSGPPCDELRPVLLERCETVRRQELIDLAADQIALRDTVVARSRGVDVDVATLVVGDEDRVERGVEDGAELLLVLAQGCLGMLALDRGAIRLAAVRSASILAGLQSRSVTQSSKPMKPHQSPPTKTGTVIRDLIPCSSKNARSPAGRSLTLPVNSSLRAADLGEPLQSDAPRSTCPA